MKRNRTFGRAHGGITLALATLLAVSISEPVAGQEDPSKPSPAGAVAGAVLGGTLGFFGGAYLGAQGDCYEICGGIVYGALTGQLLGVPLGAHLGNGGRGNLAAGLGVSLASMGLGIAGSAAASDGRFYLFSMVAQVVAVAVTEIRTSPGVTVSAGPRIIGDEVGVGMSITW